MSIRKPLTMRRRALGISLMELLLTIVIISLAITGILGAISLNAAHSADPIAQKQALSIAQSLLEEVKSTPFANLGNYAGVSFSAARMPSGYSASATVAADGNLGPGGALLPGADVRRITVTVTYNGGRDQLILEGYRANAL